MFRIFLTHFLLLSLFVMGETWNPQWFVHRYLENGVEIPYTGRSAITCAIPGLNLLYCQGPRVQTIKTSETVYGRASMRNALHNGVDLRFLRLGDNPVIRDKTEVGRSLGADVVIDERDGEAEFGDSFRALDAFRLNRGGNAAWDHHGGGGSIGWRASALENTVRVEETRLAVEYGDSARPPFRRTLAKGSALKGWNIREAYPGYRYQDDWYKQSFARIGDAFRSPAKRACPWCFAVDGVI